MLLQIEILLPAMIAGLLVLSTHVPLGRTVLQRGIVFLDLAIAQIAALGVIVAHTLWHHEAIAESSGLQLLVGTVAATIGAMGLYTIRKLAVKIQEAIIGVVFVLAATGCILLLSSDPHGGERLQEILVGQILWLNLQDLIPLAICYSIILGVWMKWQNTAKDWLFYPVFAITVTLSTQVVGVYLVFASLIIPNLVTLKQTKPIARALGLGVLGYFLGIVASSYLDLPTGAAVVWGLAVVATSYHFINTATLKPSKS